MQPWNPSPSAATRTRRRPALVLAAVVAFVFGIPLTMRVAGDLRTSHLPPVRAHLYVSVPTDDGRDQTAGKDLAAALEWRLRGDRSSFTDLRVTAQPPACLLTTRRLGPGPFCGGQALWRYSVRTKQPLDLQALSIAVGAGQVTVRADIGGAPSCTDRPLAAANPGVAKALPEAKDAQGCYAVGPMLRLLDRPLARNGVVQLDPSDTQWIETWKQQNAARRLDVLLDDRVFAVIPVTESGLSLQTNGVAIPTAAPYAVQHAIETAIDAPPPTLEHPRVLAADECLSPSFEVVRC